MKLSEMIKVMQHYADGGEVEYSNRESNIWSEASTPVWNWYHYNYRIKEQKVTIEKWLMQDTIDKEYRIIETSLVDSLINFKKIKLIESYEVEL